MCERGKDVPSVTKPIMVWCRDYQLVHMLMCSSVRFIEYHTVVMMSSLDSITRAPIHYVFLDLCPESEYRFSRRLWTYCLRI